MRSKPSFIHHSSFRIHHLTQLFAAAVAEARRGVLLLGPAGRAGAPDAQVRAAARTEVGAGGDDRAARPAAARHRRDVAPRLARDVGPPELPPGLLEPVLPLSAERRQGGPKRGNQPT